MRPLLGKLRASLHQLRFCFSPWRWRKECSHAVGTLTDGVVLFGRFYVPLKTRYVVCECGKVFYKEPARGVA